MIDDSLQALEVDDDDIERQAKADRRHAARLEYAKTFKNSMLGELSKDEKSLLKKECRDVKRIDKREKAKNKKKEFIMAMAEDERKEWIEERGHRMLKEKRDAEAKLKAGKIEGMTVIVDCGFESIMSAKELKSLAQQLNYVHIVMKKSSNLFRLALVNFKGKFVEYSKDRNIHNWDFADLETGDLADYIEKRKISATKVVYLSPDGEEELQSFESDTFYVIGGIVDSTIYPNQTADKAKAIQIKAMRLPLEEFRKINHFRPCLNINTVFEIIDNYRSLGNMHDAILQALPDRFREEYLERERYLKRHTKTTKDCEVMAED